MLVFFVVTGIFLATAAMVVLGAVITDGYEEIIKKRTAAIVSAILAVVSIVLFFIAGQISACYPKPCEPPTACFMFTPKERPCPADLFLNYSFESPKLKLEVEAEEE